MISLLSPPRLDSGSAVNDFHDRSLPLTTTLHCTLWITITLNLTTRTRTISPSVPLIAFAPRMNIKHMYNRRPNSLHGFSHCNTWSLSYPNPVDV